MTKAFWSRPFSQIFRLGLTAVVVLGSGSAVAALSEDIEAKQALDEIVDQLAQAFAVSQ